MIVLPSFMSRTFRDEAKRRGWLTKGSATHFLLDGGKLSVKDKEHGTFLNTYFVHAIIKKEWLCLVELKTPHFKLFFDIDALFPPGCERRATATIRRLSQFIWQFVTYEFFEQRPNSSESSSSLPHASDNQRMLVALSPSKKDGNGMEKHGAHLVFPGLVVNAPIAQACRIKLLERLETSFLRDEEEDTMSLDSTASSSSSHAQPMVPTNGWRDVIDDSVFKANGLRMIFSNKGPVEARPYQPSLWIDSAGTHIISTPQGDLTALREIIKLSSIRCTAGEPLSACVDGEHLLADKLDQHTSSGQLIGTSASIEMYADTLPLIRNLLPLVYRHVTFTAAFVTSHAVMLKSNSRYCQNIGGEHRTSTVYFSVTKHGGISQRCYCRKEERGCDGYSSPCIPLPPDVISVFFPGFVVDDEERINIRTSTKRREKMGLDSLVKRCSLMGGGGTAAPRTMMSRKR